MRVTRHWFFALIVTAVVIASAGLYASHVFAAAADSQTVLLIHADGADATAVFSDSARLRTVTTIGNAQIDTAQSKFGGTSALFDGTGDYLTLDGSSDFAFGTGDFAIDFWIRPNTTSGIHTLYDSRPSGTEGVYPDIYQNGTSLGYFVNSADRITGGSLSAGTWYHVAVTSSGSNTKMFLDGTQIGSTYSDSHNYLNGASWPVFGINGTVLNQQGYNGWMDEIRVSNVARWTANFTPPTRAYEGGVTITVDTIVTGDGSITGAISKGSGTFMIDHPLDPRNSLLYHSFVESPDVKNIYDGTAILDSVGEASIALPRYFLALNKDYRYLAQGMSDAMPDLHLLRGVHRKWLLGSPIFTVSGGTPGGTISWQVTGIRKDMEYPTRSSLRTTLAAGGRRA